jgi:hypothetical protein
MNCELALFPAQGRRALAAHRCSAARETTIIGGSRHRCGHGESAIVLLSRVFVPGTGFAGRPRVNRAAEVDVLTRRSPPGATFIARQRSWPGSQGWPEGPSAASRAAASSTARKSAATRGDRVRPALRDRGRVRACGTSATRDQWPYRLAQREPPARLRSDPNACPGAPILTTSMPREPKIDPGRRRTPAAQGCGSSRDPRSRCCQGTQAAAPSALEPSTAFTPRQVCRRTPLRPSFSPIP